MILKAEKITRQYIRQSRNKNVFMAVKETDFTLEGGQLVEITGRSGSGKSTFLNMLAGLLAPSSGHIFVDDTDIYAMEDKERSRFRNLNMGVIPQGQTGLQSLTVLENDPFRKLGSKANIVKFFGGKQGYLDAVKELEQYIYNIA